MIPITLLAQSFLSVLAAFPQDPPAVPEGTPLPRYKTAAEARWEAAHPDSGPRAVTAPPAGTVECVAEYEPMDGILMAWEGTSSWTTILAEMAAQITTIGDADVYVAVDSASEGNSAISKIQSEGADMGRVHTMVVTTDSIWIRDYGPRYVFQGDCRAIIDHEYNRPRPRDDELPSFFSGYMGHAFYAHALEHGGGNFHLDANNYSYLTRLINNENSGYTESQIHDVFRDYQHLDTTFFDPLPSSVDSTQHLDMWMQVAGDDVVVISDWPAQQGSTQDQRCETGAAVMATRGYQVFRIPARTVSGVHYTYTNVVMCNDIVLVPSYTNSTITQYNAQALNVWQQACPRKTVIPIGSQSIVSSAGVLHCIVMHLPRHRGGLDPTAYLVAPDANASYGQGESVDIEWISDDDVAAVSADLLLSTDSGQSWSTLVTNRAASGTYTWTPSPSLATETARIRVIVRDAGGRTGSDDSDGDFAITDAAAAVAYGSGKAGSMGVPVLSASADPVLGTSITLNIDSARANSTAQLLRGPGTAQIPFDGGTLLVADDKVYNVPINGAGHGSVTGNVPISAALAGVSYYWQAWIANDPGASGQGNAFSNGLQTRLGF
ncbi:MAG: hypothetical protein EYC70_04645 [Planctomycetota bacterium]|nr:MAG: hypothetical protein EYC70_04645 [Planctomycetota bacterium]